VPTEIHPNAMFLRGLQASAHIVAAGNNARAASTPGIASCGYEDADDLDHLRADPAFKLVSSGLRDASAK
jgi:hypothetical protein